MKITPIILAAGQGTRMKSDLPKVLHPICEKPMLWHALQAAQAASTEKPVLVIGHGAKQVRDLIGDDAKFVVQEERLGTGHAVQQAESMLKAFTGMVLVSNADMPLLTSETLSELVTRQKENAGPITMLTLIADNPRGFGRIVRDNAGSVQAIIEDADCTKEQKEIKELKAKSFSTAVETEETETVAEKLDVESRKIDENLREVEGVIDKASALSSEKKTELKEALKFLRHENTTKQQHRQSSTAKKYVGKIKEYAQDATLTAGAIDLVVRIAEFLLSVF